MARPSLKLERQKIILQAFTECIAAKGLNATTLDDIALKSQMRRSLLRHNVGNRTELINQVAEYVSTEFETIWHKQDRKSTRLNSSHKPISYAVFCLKKKKTKQNKKLFETVRK